VVPGGDFIATIQSNQNTSWGGMIGVRLEQSIKRMLWSFILNINMECHADLQGVPGIENIMSFSRRDTASGRCEPKATPRRWVGAGENSRETLRCSFVTLRIAAQGDMP